MNKLEQIGLTPEKKKKNPIIENLKKTILAAGIVATGMNTGGCGINQKEGDEKIDKDTKIEMEAQKKVNNRDYSGLGALPDEILIDATDKQLDEYRQNVKKHEKN